MKEIVEASRSAASSAYVPYSGHSIGAAIVTPEGDTYTGCNIEVSGLSSSIHAEETAVMKAIKDGESEFDAISISSEAGVTPCGMCRQTLSEFCEGDLIVIVDSTKQDEVQKYRLSDLYPDRFTYAELQR